MVNLNQRGTMKGWTTCERCTCTTPAPFYVLCSDGPWYVNVRLCQGCALRLKDVPRVQRTRDLAVEAPCSADL